MFLLVFPVNRKSSVQGNDVPDHIFRNDFSECSGSISQCNSCRKCFHFCILIRTGPCQLNPAEVSGFLKFRFFRFSDHHFRCCDRIPGFIFLKNKLTFLSKFCYKPVPDFRVTLWLYQDFYFLLCISHDILLHRQFFRTHLPVSRLYVPVPAPDREPGSRNVPVRIPHMSHHP